MKTFVPKDPGNDRNWYVVDATDQVLGRLAVKIANVLRGRIKPTYTPHVDMGDFVVVINAEKVKLTGNKDDQKVYQHYSGFRGGLREEKIALVRERHPDRIIKHAVKGMLPNNNISRQMFSRLKVYAGSEHPHEAQQPQVMEAVQEK